MTRAEKIAALEDAMTRSTRNNGTSEDGEKFYHFTPQAPKELVDLFLKHFEVRDIDYETFSRAIDMLTDIYNDNEQEADGLDFVQDTIYERSSDSASVYTSDRLTYLNMWNEEEISDLMKEYDLSSIADACAAWYDRQVEQAAIVINKWVNA